MTKIENRKPARPPAALGAQRLRAGNAVPTYNASRSDAGRHSAAGGSKIENSLTGAFAHCELCPRRCGVNRAAGELGYCRSGEAAQVFWYGAHHGEEPPVSGTRGSGTVFFSRCTMRCLYCQNYPWSQEGSGELYSVAELAGIFRALAEQGCHNWNLVSPTPWLPIIGAALEQVRCSGEAPRGKPRGIFAEPCEAKNVIHPCGNALRQDGYAGQEPQGIQAKKGKNLPVVYNTSGFERLETLRALEGLVDVYLTDLRYAQAATAACASDAAAYVTTARAALREMWCQAGPLVVDAEGIARRGVICRVLILPGHSDEACASLEWLAAEIGPQIAVSIMAQYTPAYRAPGRTPWDRAITREEYEAVCQTAERLGLTEGYIQDFSVVDSRALAGFNLPPCRKTVDEASKITVDA